MKKEVTGTLIWIVINPKKTSRISIKTKKIYFSNPIIKIELKPIKIITTLLIVKSFGRCFLKSILEFCAIKIPDNITPKEKATENHSRDLIFLNHNTRVCYLLR